MQTEYRHPIWRLQVVVSFIVMIISFDIWQSNTKYPKKELSLREKINQYFISGVLDAVQDLALTAIFIIWKVKVFTRCLNIIHGLFYGNLLFLVVNKAICNGPLSFLVCRVWSKRVARYLFVLMSNRHTSTNFSKNLYNKGFSWN